MNDLDMFVNFRRELDVLAFPLIKDISDYREIKYNDKVVGFLMVEHGYVDSIYVEPMYRKQGLARKAVMDYLAEGKIIGHLHIINTNDTAYKFWNSVLSLVPEETNHVDTLYRVISVKKKEKIVKTIK